MRVKRNTGEGCAAKRMRKWQDPSLPQKASVLLVWIQTNTAPFSRLCRNVTREVTSYLSVPVLLPAIYEGRLYVVNVLNRQYRSIPLSAAEFREAAFFPIDHVTVVCMKGGNRLWTACVLDLSTFAFTELLPCHPFDCLDAPLECCVSGILHFCLGECEDWEKYAIQPKRWTELPDISIDSEMIFAFAVKESICTGSEGDPLSYQVFDLVSEQLGPPIPLVSSPCIDCCSVIVQSDGQLLALSYDWENSMNVLWAWDWHKQHIQLRQGTKAGWEDSRINGFTLRIEKELYWLDMHKPVVHRFNMDKLTEHKREFTLE